MSQLQGAPIDKILSILLLGSIVSLLAIGLERQRANENGANTGFGAGVDAARIGFVRVNDDMNVRPQLEARTPIEKRFVFQGPGNEELSLEDISGIDVNFNSNNNNNKSNNKRTNKSSRDGNNDTDDENNDDDDDDDADSDDEDNDRNKNDNSRTANPNSKPDRQQADIQGVNGAKDQLVALANANGTTTKVTGAGAASGGVSAANAKPDESQRPRLFKMGLLIG